MTEVSEVPVVLVVDDSAVVRRQVTNALARVNVAVLEAAHGQEALEVFDSHTVELLITDINMPRMSGVELLNALSARGVRVPTIVLTSEMQVGALRDARAAGALAWITKPFDPDMLTASVVRALSRPSARAGGGR